MQKWDYRVITDEGGDFEGKLRASGDDGWELVSVAVTTVPKKRASITQEPGMESRQIAYLKREKPGP